MYICHPTYYDVAQRILEGHNLHVTTNIIPDIFAVNYNCSEQEFMHPQKCKP